MMASIQGADGRDMMCLSSFNRVCGEDNSCFEDDAWCYFKLEDFIYNMMTILISSVDHANAMGNNTNR